MFAANPLGESPLFFVYGIFRFCPYFEVRIFALSFRIWLLYSRHNCYYEKTGSEVKNITDEIPFDIPDSWCWTKIQNFAQLGMGQTVLTKDMLKTGTPVYSATIENKPLGYINEVHNNIKLKIGDLVIPARGNSIGYVTYISEEPATCTQTTIYEKFIDKRVSIWISYFYQAFQKTLFKYSGAAIPQITLSMLEKQYIPLPPLAEQERIVAEIEKFEPLIKEYDKLEQQATKLDGEIYDKLKKSILQYAIQGKLVPQDSNDEPAAVLLERIRAEKKAQLGKKYVESYIYKGDDNCYYEHINGKDVDITEDIPFDLPDSWAWSRWGELSDSIQYGYNAPAKQSGRIKMIRISDIHENQVMWENVPYCDIAEEDISTYLLKENDILFARTGGTVGKSFLVQNIKEEAIYAGYLIRTRYNSKLIPQYFKYFMESPLYWSQLRNGTIATAQPNCNGQTLSKMIVPVPPLAEQKRIVEKIDEIFAKL